VALSHAPNCQRSAAEQCSGAESSTTRHQDQYKGVGLGPIIQFNILLMLNLTTLSDVQSEVMQGGSRRPSRPTRPGRPSGGDITQTTTNVVLDVSQSANALAFTLGGKNSLAYNEVSQWMGVSVNTF
jgi:hypothetical protein